MVDFKKNETVMKAAWKEVTDEKCSTDWALFGYQGQTTSLTLVSKGEDGIDELMEDLNPSKILYGFLKVEDPKTSLPKYVILNWQGETAPSKMKGTCALHLRDVQHFLHGYHLVVNVRNEDEIDMESIVKKVSEITGSSYNFKQKPQGMEHSPEPVGTAHRKINPMQELPNMSEREKFWTKDQNDEKKRIQGERDRRTEDQKKAEEERKRREEKESEAREVQVKERERVTAQMKDKEGKSQAEKEKEKSMWEKQQEEDANEARERSQRAERMRQERAKEAKLLIQGSSSEARKIFTRNSSQGQMNVAPALKPRSAAVNNHAANNTNSGVGRSWPPKSNGNSSATPPTYRRSPAPAKKDEIVEETVLQPSVASTATLEPPSNSAPSYDSTPVTPPAPISPTPVVAPPEMLDSSERKDEACRSDPVELESPSIAPPPGFQGSDDSRDGTVSPDTHKPPNQDDVTKAQQNGGQDLHHAQPVALDKEPVTLESYGICAVSLYDYQASDETEISFDPGQIITHIDQIDPGWWQGLGPDGTYGLFPANYVEIIDSSELQFE